MKKLVSLSMLLFLLTACTQLNQTEEKPEIKEYASSENITVHQNQIPHNVLIKGQNTLEDLIILTTKENYSVSIKDSLKIVERVDEGKVTFASYKFMYDSTPYFGLYIAWKENNKWYKINSSENVRLNNNPGEIEFITGKSSIPIHPNQIQTYFAEFGYINNENITRVTLEYTDRTLSTIEIGKGQDLFMDSYIDGHKDIKKVTMLDKDGKILMQREWKRNTQTN